MESKIKIFRSDEIDCITDEDGFLGKGSYGIVLCGFHRIHGTVAAKCSVMQGNKKKKETIAKKIKDEIGLLQTSNHENIVRVHGWTQWSGAVAIIMEYLPGGNLMELLLDIDVDLQPPLRLRMGFETANGIAFIHNLTPDNRITHGDIKPENILLTEDLHCKIGDFGGARLSAYTREATMKNKQQNGPQYTELYAAPEVVEDPTCEAKPSRDIYSFGMTIYMLLGRKIPVSAEYMKMYLEQVKKGKRPTRESINGIIRQLVEEERSSDAKIIITLKDVMKKCWEQEANLRPKMIDVKNDLHEHLANQNRIKIQQQAVEVIEKMEIETLARGRNNCVPLDQFSPPEFKCNAGALSLSENTSGVATSSYSNSDFKAESNVSYATTTTHLSNEDGSSCANSHNPSLLPPSSLCSSLGAELIHPTDFNPISGELSQESSSFTNDASSTATSPTSLNSTSECQISGFNSVTSSLHYIGDVSSRATDPTPSLVPPASLYSLPDANTILPRNANPIDGELSQENNKRLLENIKSIKDSIENKELSGHGISACESLITESLDFDTRDYDIIIDDVIEISSALFASTEYKTAINTLKWIAGLCDKITDSQLRMKKLFDLSYAVHLVSYEMSKRTLTNDIEQSCLPLLRDLHEKVKLVEISDLIFKAKTESRSMLHIGTCYFYCKNFRKADEMGESARQKFSVIPNSNKYSVYAACYFLSATANHKQGNYKKAVALYRGYSEALKAVEDQSEDWRGRGTDLCTRLKKSAIKQKSPSPDLNNFKFAL